MAITVTIGSFVLVLCGARGKTRTAFGSQEWLKRAMVGEILTPIGVRDGDVTVNALVVNCFSLAEDVHDWGLRNTHAGDKVNKTGNRVNPIRGEFSHRFKSKVSNEGVGHMSVELGRLLITG